MIFQVLGRRRRYLLTLVEISLSILYSLPVFASALQQAHLGNLVLFKTSTIVAQQTPVEQKVSLFQQLNLTGEQQQQIKQIQLRYQQQLVKKKQHIAKLQQQLSDMMVGTETVELLRAKNQRLSRARQELGSLRFESMLATREILTLQQRQKFRELVKDFSEIE